MDIQAQVVNLIGLVVAGLITILGSYITLAVAKYKAKLDLEITKVTDDNKRKLFADALELVNNLIYDNVVYIQTNVVESVKEAIADGRVDKAELEVLAIECKEKVLSQLTEGSKKALSDGIDDLDEYIKIAIERTLSQIKGQI